MMMVGMRSARLWGCLFFFVDWAVDWSGADGCVNSKPHLLSFLNCLGEMPHELQRFLFVYETSVSV
jgi:hypothetical protein